LQTCEGGFCLRKSLPSLGADRGEDQGFPTGAAGALRASLSLTAIGAEGRPAARDLPVHRRRQRIEA
jgi:hypothetical protein